MRKILVYDYGLTLEEGIEEFINYCIVKNLREETINHHRSICRTIYKFLEP
ncbi:hypothetical protein AB2T96_18610 [Clostridium butyricum]|uniref:hypothetical protein n=1 Tax=Clostridium butyricum TaxID=1492 RepID=UPI003466B647